VEITTRQAAAADTDFAREAYHAAYRDVVERQFGPWDEAAGRLLHRRLASRGGGAGPRRLM
jgi:hypothetical protein